MEFGAFDHMDIGDVPIREHFETRLRIAELYDKAGFRAYHIAEHHCTPLGMAPSPSVFLAAVAQRTTRLRLGALVFALPLYHPLRLIEEICMLDHMSGGRLELGFGRGASPIEASFFGLDADQVQAHYAEGLQLVIKGLTSDVLDFDGAHFRLENVPMAMRPLQRPHPPLWYGLHSAESGERAAVQGLNVISNGPAERVRPAFERYREVWAERRPAGRDPYMGVVRFVVVGETEAEALAVARRAYPVWHRGFNFLYHRLGRSPMLGERAQTFDELHAAGIGVAGTPATVAAFLREQTDMLGANYCVGQFAFGDQSYDEVKRTVDLFNAEVRPQLEQAEPRRGQPGRAL